MNGIHSNVYTDLEKNKVTMIDKTNPFNTRDKPLQFDEQFLYEGREAMKTLKDEKLFELITVFMKQNILTTGHENDEFYFNPSEDLLKDYMKELKRRYLIQPYLYTKLINKYFYNGNVIIDKFKQ